jgi:hypothetical protein
MEQQVDHSLPSNAEVKPLSTNILSGTLATTLSKQPYSVSEILSSLSLGCANISSSYRLMAAITYSMIFL